MESSAEQEVDAALTLLDDMSRIISDPAARGEISAILRRLGFQIGLSFTEGTKGKKRRVRRLAGGIVTFGDALKPTFGNNDRGTAAEGHGHDEASRKSGKNGSETPEKQTVSAGRVGPRETVRLTKSLREGVSSIKGNRGDRT
ncbi:MAG: hypothetical protein ACYC35_03900 [Pirellulales bacterium]